MPYVLLASQKAQTLDFPVQGQRPGVLPRGELDWVKVGRLPRSPQRVWDSRLHARSWEGAQEDTHWMDTGMFPKSGIFKKLFPVQMASLERSPPLSKTRLQWTHLTRVKGGSWRQSWCLTRRPV